MRRSPNCPFSRWWPATSWDHAGVEGPWQHYPMPHQGEREHEERHARYSLEQGPNYRVLESWKTMMDEGVYDHPCQSYPPRDVCGSRSFDMGNPRHWDWEHCIGRETREAEEQLGAHQCHTRERRVRHWPTRGDTDSANPEGGTHKPLP